jgi:hypothetical protein
MSMNKKLVTWGGKWKTWMLHGEGNGGLGSYKGEGKDDVMVTWGSPFVLVAFKTLSILFNIFLTISLNFKIYHVFHQASLRFKMGWLNECS